MLERRGIRRQNPFIGITLHREEDSDYAVLINYTAAEQETGVRTDHRYRKTKVLYGNGDRIEPFGAAVLRLEK